MAAEPTKLAQVLRDGGVSIVLLKVASASVKAIVRERLHDRPLNQLRIGLMEYSSGAAEPQ
jgi:hypothetical protein